MKKLIITVDLGHFKAYRVSKRPMESTRVQLIGSYDSIDGHGKLSDKLSDSAGRFGVSGGKKGAPKGYGDPHNIELETEKKLIKMIAQDINKLVSREDCPWYLAADKQINRQITENLSQDARKKLDKNITSDLTKAPKSEILDYFS